MYKHVSPLSFRAVTLVSGFLWIWQGSVFLLRCHKAVTRAILLWVNTRGDNRVNTRESVVSAVDWDIVVFWNGGTTPGVLLHFQFENSSSWLATRMPGLLSCDGNAGIAFLTKQGNCPSSRDEEGKTGLYLSCGRTLGVSLEWRWVCWGTSWITSRCQGPFRGSRGTVRFLSRDATVEKSLISHWWENLLVFLELRQETRGSSWVTTGTSGTCLCCLRKV